jgi:LCP family protein required for cell wall assembly
MSDTPSQSGPVQPAVRRRRGLRIALLSLAAFVVLAGAVAGGGFLFVNHMADSIQRIHVRFTRLDAASRPTGEYDGYGGAMTVLITGEGIGPTGDAGTAGPADSGLIMLLHINAEGYSGGVVSIPPQAVVWVPGHGRTAIQNALTYGGPSLLIQTVQQLTHVQIDHYARIDFNHVDNVVNAMGGVTVRLPDQTDGFGHIFHVGVNDLTGTTALDYAREQNLTEEGRVLRQQSLIRAVVRKLVHRHLLSNPVTDYQVLHALISMLTVDSNFTTAELEHLAMQVRDLVGSAEYVTAPVHVTGSQVYLDSRISGQLWAAIRQDAITAFAAKYPFTVTPAAPR